MSGSDTRLLLVEDNVADVHLIREALRQGLDVLTEIHAEPALGLTPVIVLTTSTSERDLLGAYQQGANCYVVKPVDFEHFQVVLGAIENFWMGVVRLPPRATRVNAAVAAP